MSASLGGFVHAGADVDIPDENGVTALEDARGRGLEAIERILVEARE